MSCACQMCLTGMPEFCLGTSLESSQVSQEVESTHSPTNDYREDGELNEVFGLDGSSGESDRETDSNDRRGQSRRSGQRGRIATLGDQQSSGRKIAARLFPLYPETPCEWRNLANCGGSQHPIVGCLNGIQQARHHGPDKNVANNEVGNVHRICHACHVRWHKANDPGYDWNETNPIPHSPRQMTTAEQQEAAMLELKYRASKVKAMADE